MQHFPIANNYLSQRLLPIGMTCGIDDEVVCHQQCFLYFFSPSFPSHSL